MAQRILGVDLGAYSVKVVVASGGLRRTTVHDVFELPLPPAASPEETTEERAVRVLGTLVKERGFEHDTPWWALPGDQLSMRVLEFQFSGLKRADLDKAVGAELESQLPHELDELVYDFDVIPQDGPGTRILAAATTRERVGR